LGGNLLSRPVNKFKYIYYIYNIKRLLQSSKSCSESAEICYIYTMLTWQWNTFISV